VVETAQLAVILLDLLHILLAGQGVAEVEQRDLIILADLEALATRLLAEVEAVVLADLDL
jgi:hypothetical protein